jgi:hypothetical protein
MKAFSGEPQRSLITAADARSTRRADTGKKRRGTLTRNSDKGRRFPFNLFSYYPCKNKLLGSLA